MSARVTTWSPEELAARSEEVLDVYAEAMGVPRPLAGARRTVLAGHLGRPGLRAVAALDDAGALVGTAYGHLGEDGQWWHDQVVAALRAQGGDDVAGGWSGSFEVCELHVRPAHQGTGLGRALLALLLRDVPAPRALLTTPDEETRARAFYRAGGWVDLVRRLRFPGDPRDFAVLGLQVGADRV